MTGETTVRGGWSRLSPLLDELLDQTAGERARHLARLEAEDPALGAELRTLLGRLTTIEREAFLEQPAMPSAHAVRPDAAPAWGGRQLGAYELVREIGRGGMGSVWLGQRTDGRYDGQVAIKLLRSSLFGAGAAARFAREGRILGKLDHPHIARLLDAGVSPDGAVPYLVLEHIDGLPIDTYCDQHGLDVSERLRLFLDVLSAVGHAHNRLILHRDLKPSNIMVSIDGQVKLLDFGIAKLLTDAESPAAATELTREAGSAYTLRYAAPEQVMGEEVSTATDVHALGVLLYLLLSGRHPLADTAGVDLPRAVQETTPPRPSEVLRRQADVDAGAARRARALKGDLDTIVAKAMKKRPQDRYANATELAEDLRRHLAHAPITARPDTLAYRSAKFLRRHATAVAGGTAVTLALAGAAAVALRQADHAQAQRLQAEGLIEYMLGDLRKKLQPVGRLDVLDGVGDQALAYYARQPITLDADAQGRRARALHLLGEIAEQRGQLESATERFRQAAAGTAALLAASPTDGQRVFDHAQSEYWLGFVAWRRGQLGEAEAAFQRYLALALQLTQLDPSRDDWRMELAQAHHNLGVLRVGAARGAQAVAAFDDSLAVWRSFAQPTPERLLNEADTLGWLAVAHESVGALDQAVTALETKKTRLARAVVPGAPASSQADYLAAENLHEIGRLQLMMGNPRSALAHATQAVASLRALVAHEPANLHWQATAAFAQVGLAESELALQQRDAARTNLQAAERIITPLLATDARKAYWQIELQGRWRALQVLASTPGDREQALQALGAYLEQARAWQAAGNQPDVPQRLVMARALLLAGDAMARVPADAARARGEWQAIGTLLQPLVAQRNAAAMALLAHAQWRLGQSDEARARAAAVEATLYRHPIHTELVARLATPHPGRPLDGRPEPVPRSSHPQGSP